MNQAEGVRQVVERARAGDQVAMALIDQTRRQAEQGNKRAKKSRKLIQAYINKYPASPFAGDLPAKTNPTAQRALWLARRGDSATFAKTVAQAAPHVGPWALTSVILHGPQLTRDSPLMAVANTPKSKIGLAVNRAYRLQRIAVDPKTPISSYCLYTAVELGE